MPIKRKSIKYRNPSDKVLLIGVFYEEGVTASKHYPASLANRSLKKEFIKDFDMKFDEILRVDSDLDIEVI